MICGVTYTYNVCEVVVGGGGGGGGGGGDVSVCACVCACACVHVGAHSIALKLPHYIHIPHNELMGLLIRIAYTIH